ncbi:hypothetical protein WDU94_014130, partial [Cyamophila willieti]
MSRLLLVLGVLVLMTEPSSSSDHQMNNDESLHGINTIQHIYEAHQDRHKRSARSSQSGTPSKDSSSLNKSLFAPLSIINWNIEGIKYQLTQPEKLFQDADLVMLTETLNTDRPASLPG